MPPVDKASHLYDAPCLHPIQVGHGDTQRDADRTAECLHDHGNVSVGFIKHLDAGNAPGTSPASCSRVIRLVSGIRRVVKMPTSMNRA